jgi:hypothetical protein
MSDDADSTTGESRLSDESGNAYPNALSNPNGVPPLEVAVKQISKTSASKKQINAFRAEIAILERINEKRNVKNGTLK